MRKNKVIYASSYDRGLPTLLELWSEVRKEVPDAELEIFYGWDSFDNVHNNNPDMMKWKWGVIRQLHQLKDQGVTEHGRVDHQTLADKFKEAKVLAYPTEFNEIFMITMIKALAAGCIPVSTHCYAIKETQGGFGYMVECEDIYTNSAKRKEFVEAIVKALRDKTYDGEKASKWAIDNYSWDKIAKQWEEALL